MDYAERKMRAGDRGDPDGTWRFEDVFDNEEVAATLPLAGRGHGEGRRDARCISTRPPQVRAGINMTYTALLVDRLLRGEVGGGPDHPAECRAGAAAHGRRAPKAAS